MPRKNAKTNAEQSVAAEPLPVSTLESPASPEAPSIGERSQNGQAAEAGRFSAIPDPRGSMTAALSADKGGPKIELLRSHRFNQMQLRSDEPLSDQHKDQLAQAGWTDRTEKEGIFTKQLPKEGEKWRETADAEKLFKQIANKMRADKGLGDVLVGM